MAERKTGKRQSINAGTDKRDAGRAAARAGVKTRQLHDRIEVDPDVQHGKPVIKGTRVPVSRILGAIAGGMSFAEVADAYGVTIPDVKAAVTFANEVLADSTFYATSL